MKDARELLAKLRAAGVEPMSTTDLKRVATDWGMNLRSNSANSIRLLADLLEARAKLAAVRAWAEDAAVDVGTPLGGNALCVLEILDREPEP